MTDDTRRPQRRAEYNIAVICALKLAAEALGKFFFFRSVLGYGRPGPRATQMPTRLAHMANTMLCLPTRQAGDSPMRNQLPLA